MTVTKEDIRKKLEGYVADYDRKIEMWSNVQIATKKDGTEFKNFSQNFLNAKVINEYGDLKLRVSDYSREKHPNYVSDEIRLEWNVTDWKHGEISENRIIKPFPYSRPYFRLNVQETQQAIKDRIANCMEWRQRNIFDLERLDAAYEYVETTLRDMRKKLEELAPPNGIYSSSLYYALQEKIQKFPY